jgi:hypothetical protein
MNITFSGNYTINPQTFGINFEATVNGQSVVCSVSTEALQDIDPSNAHNTAQQQFLANQSNFQAIAEQKIRAGATSPVAITSSDVCLIQTSGAPKPFLHEGKPVYLFDRVEEKNINGIFEVFAVNEQDNQAYLLRNVIISTSESTLDGLSLSISCYPEKYVYRGSFNTASEMKVFADSVLRLLYEASKKNYAIPCA